MRHRSPIAVALSLILTGFVLTALTPMLALARERVGDSEVVYQSDNGKLIVAPADDVTDRAAWDPTADMASLAGPSMMAVDRDKWPNVKTLANSKSKDMAPNGFQGNTSVRFASSVYYNNAATRSLWEGSSTAWASIVDPWAPKKTNLKLRFHTKGIPDLRELPRSDRDLRVR